MAKLYYGNGEVTIEASIDIRGVEINYSGAVSISGESEGVLKMHQNNKIIVVSLKGQPLKHLFNYSGEIKIISVLVADNNGEKVPTTVHRVMDYSELLTSNAEDMTEIKVEDMKVGRAHGKKQTSESPQILENLHTSSHNGSLYFENGEEYSGDFHVHTKDGGAMTGKRHSGNSQLLYIKLVLRGEAADILVPTNNIKSASKKHKGFGKRIRINRKIRYGTSGNRPPLSKKGWGGKA